MHYLNRVVQRIVKAARCGVANDRARAAGAAATHEWDINVARNNAYSPLLRMCPTANAPACNVYILNTDTIVMGVDDTTNRIGQINLGAAGATWDN